MAQTPGSTTLEYTWLPEPSGPTLEPAEVRATTASLNRDLYSLSRTAGDSIHEIGTGLKAVYAGLGHVALGFPNFGAYLRASYPERSRRVLERYMSVAEVATRDEATAYGADRIEVAADLCVAYECANLDALKKLDLPAGKGKTVRFPATVRALRLALKWHEGTKRREEKAAEARKAPVRQLRKDFEAPEALPEGVRTNVYATREGPRVNLRGLAPEDFEAVGRYLLELAKRQR